VTTFEYFYSYKSGFEIDYDSAEVNIYANDAEINLETAGQRNINVNSGQDISLIASRDATLAGSGAVSITNYSNADGVYITTNADGALYQWQFDETGNLTLPGNTFAVNYANGTAVSLGGGGPVNTGNVTFDNINIIGDGNLKLQPDPANSDAYLDIFLTTGPDIHIAGNGETVILGTDDFANVAVNVDGNVSIQSSNGTPYTWTFDTAGNLTLPGNASSINYADGSPFSGAPVNTGDLTFNQSTIATTQSNAYINFNAFSAGDIDVGTNDAKNVVIRTDGSTANNAWTFDAVGNLTLPRGGIVYETSIPYSLAGNTIALAPSGGTNADQQLLVYPTAGNVDANHLHMTTGNLYNTELFLGDDNLYVKLANTGNVIINSNDALGNTAQWSFDALGNLTLPAGGAIQTAPGSSGDICLHPDDGGRILIQGANSTLVLITSDLPDVQNRIELDTYGANLGQTGGGVFVGQYIRTNGPSIINDRLASFAGKGTEDGSTAGNVAAKITLDAAGNWSTGSTPTHISFWTTPTASNVAVEQMRVGPAGNLFVYNGGNLVLSGGNITGANVIIANAVSTTGNITTTANVSAGNISTTGTVTATGKIGYASGSTVTQTVNRGNGVTINALAGTIITTSAAMVATQIDTFSVANNQVDPNNDIVLVQIVSPNFGVYNCIAQPSSTISVSLNGFYVNIQNISGFTTSNEAITIRFMVIKAPNA
jgi:hypothetical protein